MYNTSFIFKGSVLLLALWLISCSKSETLETSNTHEVSKTNNQKQIDSMSKDQESIDEFIKKYNEHIIKRKELPPTPESIKYEKLKSAIKDGSPFPHFTANDSKQNTISDTDFNQGYVFYAFWSTWCSSCIENIAALRDMNKAGLLNHIKLVSVSVDHKRENWEQYLYQYDMEDYITNILIGKNREHPLSDFMYMQALLMEDDKMVETYHYVTPAYCLVKDGVIVTNAPVLPKDQDGFLAQLN